MRTLGPYRIAQGAIAMKDPAPFDDAGLGAIFEDGKILYAVSDPCRSGLM